MSSMTVTELAKLVGTPVEKLLEQFKDAGVMIDAPDKEVSEEDKERLLSHLRRPHGRIEISGASDKVTLKRKTLSQLKVSSKHSRGTVVEVEVRKKRAYLKHPSETEKAAETEESAKKAALEPVVTPAESSIFNRPKLSSIEEEIRQKTVSESKEEEIKASTPPKEQESLPIKEGEKKEEQVAEPPVLEEEASKPKAKKKAKGKAKRGAFAQEEPFDLFQGLTEPDEKEQEEEPVRRKSGRRELKLESGKVIKRSSKKITQETQAENITALTQHKFERPTEPVVKEVSIPEAITVGELAQKMSLKSSEVIKALMKAGMMATINQSLDQATASIIVEELGHKPVLRKENPAEQLLASLLKESEGEAVQRPAVVTVMGHVDHGKTSLLDAIRKTQVAAGEAGGITQHIGAYRVQTPKGDITFLDTPGHAAFTAMRARGSACTDIVVLVVAADDGVMPQTEEAILHAKAAKVPIIVAVNKMDKPGVDIEKIKTALAAKEVVPEEWGGDNLFVKVSAKTGEGISELLNAISLQAEVADLKAVKEGPVTGVVIESGLDKGRGPVATVLIQQGTLRQGDIVLAGGEYGRIRTLLNENGQPLPEATPSVPVQVFGFSGVPRAGDKIFTVPNERQAKEISEYLARKQRETQQVIRPLEKAEAFAQLEQSGLKKIPILLKADVQGSVEALSNALEKLSNPEVIVSIVYKGVGGITESDVHLAKASKAMIIGFNVRSEQTAKALADEERVRIYYYSIIYDALDQIQKMVQGMVEPILKEVVLGIAEVKEIFKASKMAVVAGCLVVEGVVRKDKSIRVLRNQTVIYDGLLLSLRHYKDEVAEVRMGSECGIGIKDFNDIKVGDRIEVYEKVQL